MYIKKRLVDSRLKRLKKKNKKKKRPFLLPIGYLRIKTVAAKPRKVVVVTGASTGIGLATVRLLRGFGYTVFGTVRSAADGEQFGDDEGLMPLLMDVTDEGSIEAAVSKVAGFLEAGDEVVGLVNNAGIATSAPLSHVPLDVVRSQFEVNVMGVLAVTQAFLPLLQGGDVPGRIINISSVAGRVTTPFLGPYAASKQAMEALSDAFRRELQPFGVKVIIIRPGPIATPIWVKEVEETVAEYEDTPYGPVLGKVQRHFSRRGEEGLPPEAVARIALVALQRVRPRTRYLITQRKLSTYLLWALPDKMLDRMLVKRMGLAALGKIAD